MFTRESIAGMFTITPHLTKFINSIRSTSKQNFILSRFYGVYRSNLKYELPSTPFTSYKHLIPLTNLNKIFTPLYKTIIKRQKNIF